MFDLPLTEFNRHANKWQRETGYLSSPSEKYLHPSYARIIGMGRPILGLLLARLRDQPADWFFALRAITGQNPVTDNMAGDMKKMCRAWLKWGEKNGLYPTRADDAG